MKRFNIIFSLILIAGFTCSDLLLASKGTRLARKEPVEEEAKEPVEVEEGEGFDEKAQDPIALRRKLDVRGPGGNTPLHRAARAGDWKTVEKLVKLGANIEVLNGDEFTHLRDRKTPLEVTTDEKVQKFLQANVDLLNFTGVINISKGSVQKALDDGAYVNACGYHGRTALYNAARCGRTDIIELLLAKKANPNVQNNRGVSILTIVATMGNKAAVKLLLDRSVLVNSRDNLGMTALHRIVELYEHGGRPDIVKQLLVAGANKSLRDGLGRTALEIVQKNGYRGSEVIVDLLKD